MPVRERTVLLDGKTYVVEGDIERSTYRIHHQGFVGPQQVLEFASWISPIGIGLLNATGVGEGATRRSADEENVLSVWPGRFTLGPVQNLVTLGDANLVFNGLVGGSFYEGLNTLFLFGKAVSGTAIKEPVFYWIGGVTSPAGVVTATWNNATVRADLPDQAGDAEDHNDITGMVQIGATLYCINRTLWRRNATPDRNHTAKATAATVWSADVTTGSEDNIGSAYFLVEYQGLLITLSLDTTTNEVLVKRRTPGNNTTWSQGATGTTKVSTFDNTAGAPRGLLKWHDGAVVPVEDLFLTTNRGLFWYDVSVGTLVKLVAFLYPRGSYTGVMCIGPDDALYFADGPSLRRFNWEVSGGRSVRTVGPESFDDPSKSETVWAGLPAAKQGHVTALHAWTSKPWLSVAYGGLAASKNPWVGIYNVLTGQWNCPYKKTTAQRIITAIYNSYEDDSIDRTHLLETTTTAGASADQDTSFLEKLTINPANDTSWLFGVKGIITSPWFDAGESWQQKGFLTQRIVVEGLSLTETVAFKLATDGGALGALQTIDSTTSPSHVFTDGAGAVGTDAKRLQWEMTLNRGGTLTNGPKVLAAILSYMPRPHLKADNTALETYRMTLVITPRTMRNRSGIKSMAQIADDLLRSYEKRTLVKLVYGPTTKGINAKVMLDPPVFLGPGPQWNPISQGAEPMRVQITAREFI